MLKTTDTPTLDNQPTYIASLAEPTFHTTHYPDFDEPEVQIRREHWVYKSDPTFLVTIEREVYVDGLASDWTVSISIDGIDRDFTAAKAGRIGIAITRAALKANELNEASEDAVAA